MTMRFTDTTKPTILYKYRDWDNEFHQQLISKKTIYLAQPYDFNDPFDVRIPVRWDLMTEQEIYNKNLELIKTMHFDKPDRVHIEFADNAKKNKELWFEKEMVRERPVQLDEWNKKTGLISLSETKDNILLWSHYSKNHTGFVVGFWTDELMANSDFDYLDKINYLEKYPIIKGTDDHTTQFYKKMFSKSKHWEYEKEWRITKMHPKNRQIELNNNTFAEVIIGCQANEKTKEQIIKHTKKYLPAAKLFQASTDLESFKIVLKEIL